MNKKAIYVDKEIKEVLELSKNILGYSDLGVAIKEFLLESPKFKKLNKMVKELNKIKKEEWNQQNTDVGFVEKK